MKKLIKKQRAKIYMQAARARDKGEDSTLFLCGKARISPYGSPRQVSNTINAAYPEISLLNQEEDNIENLSWGDVNRVRIIALLFCYEMCRK